MAKTTKVIIFTLPCLEHTLQDHFVTVLYVLSAWVLGTLSIISFIVFCNMHNQWKIFPPHSQHAHNYLSWLLYNVLYIEAWSLMLIFLVASCYKKHENEKKHAYDQRIREVEHSTFTPLVLSATGGLARQATTFYKRLSTLLALKHGHPYGQTMNWLRCVSAIILPTTFCNPMRHIRDREDFCHPTSSLFSEGLWSNLKSSTKALNECTHLNRG